MAANVVVEIAMALMVLQQSLTVILFALIMILKFGRRENAAEDGSEKPNELEEKLRISSKK